MNILLKPKEAAVFLTISEKSLANARSSGVGIVIPFIKIGGSVRYKQSDLEKYIQENTFNHTGERREERNGD
jgi:dimeric dUTPase (all-alpha-NTP-PPase superfamily)